MHIRNKVAVCIVALCIPFQVLAAEGSYEETVARWRSHDEVGKWLDKNFDFDKSRQDAIQKRLEAQGPAGLLVRSPEKLFAESKGYCGDSANFALKSLNRINPSYNARWVFIKNDKGRPNHWVTAFD